MIKWLVILAVLLVAVIGLALVVLRLTADEAETADELIVVIDEVDTMNVGDELLRINGRPMLAIETRALVIVTHDLEIADQAPRRITLKDGEILTDEQTTQAAGPSTPVTT